MIEVTKVTDTSIELNGVHFKDGELVEQIMEVCHKFKHLYKDGYPCGRKARLKKGERTEKWDKSPGICFTYLITNDTKGHHLSINVLVSNVEQLREKYPDVVIMYFLQMYLQDVADGIMAIKA